MTDLSTRTQPELPRRRFLGYLASAAGGALVGSVLSGSGKEQSEADVSSETVDNEVITLSAEQAEAIKENAAIFAKNAFAREGFSGKRQSDSLTAEQWNPTTRMTLTLQYKPGAKQNIMDITADDLEGVSITYATNDAGIGEGAGHEPQGTIPTIGADGSAFSVYLYEAQLKPSPDSTSNQHEDPEVFHHLQVSATDFDFADSANGAPLKPAPIYDIITSAFEQFN